MLINTHHVVINETRWNIIKVEVSNISIIITEDGPKSVSERELYNMLGATLVTSCIEILEITKTEGHRIAGS